MPYPAKVVGVPVIFAHGTLMEGISAATSARQVGNAALPDVGPAKMQLALSVPNIWSGGTSLSNDPVMLFQIATSPIVDDPGPTMPPTVYGNGYVIPLSTKLNGSAASVPKFCTTSEAPPASVTPKQIF